MWDDRGKPAAWRLPTVAVHRFPCPKCGKTLKVDDAMLEDIRRRGKGGHCPKCKAPVPIVNPRLQDAPAQRDESDAGEQAG
jgi:predicted RNA-binding Zn-ribbon protein involved in translation (DUF1610 family)